MVWIKHRSISKHLRDDEKSDVGAPHECVVKMCDLSFSGCDCYVIQLNVHVVFRYVDVLV